MNTMSTSGRESQVSNIDPFAQTSMYNITLPYYDDDGIRIEMVMTVGMIMMVTW